MKIGGSRVYTPDQLIRMIDSESPETILVCCQNMIFEEKMVKYLENSADDYFSQYAKGFYCDNMGTM